MANKDFDQHSVWSFALFIILLANIHLLSQGDLRAKPLSTQLVDCVLDIFQRGGVQLSGKTHIDRTWRKNGKDEYRVEGKLRIFIVSLWSALDFQSQEWNWSEFHSWVSLRAKPSQQSITLSLVLPRSFSPGFHSTHKTYPGEKLASTPPQPPPQLAESPFGVLFLNANLLFCPSRPF